MHDAVPLSTKCTASGFSTTVTAEALLMAPETSAGSTAIKATTPIGDATEIFAGSCYGTRGVLAVVGNPSRSPRAGKV